MSALLLVEDDPGVAEALRLALTSLDHRVEVAGDGPAALAALARGQFQVLLLDVMLPGIDGFETARRVRARSLLPIIMLTARSDPMDVVAGLECGADDYVTKPVSRACWTPGSRQCCGVSHPSTTAGRSCSAR